MRLLKTKIGDLIDIFVTTEVVASLVVLEVIAFVLTAAGITGALILPFFYETESVSAQTPQGTEIITLTGLAHSGTWTAAEVTGSNYWSSSFEPARPVLHVGVPTLLRFKSADVVHTFYSPALEVGPVEVYPGHVEQVLVTPKRTGVFEYYCTTMCGMPHFNMRGAIVVWDNDTADGPEATVTVPDEYWLTPAPGDDAPLVERGASLFRQKGCITCHGPEGQGGVPNWNYINDTIPPLNTLAEKMFLFFPEDVEAVVEPLERGQPLASLEADPPVPRFGAVLAQYESIRNVMRNGNVAGKKDPEGPEPPLKMPAWRHQLTDTDIDALIAFLLTRVPG